MKRLACIALASLVFLAGCLPLSIHPLHGAGEEPVFDEGLLGWWHVENEPHDRFEIVRGEGKLYASPQHVKDSHLPIDSFAVVRLGERTYLDLLVGSGLDLPDVEGAPPPRHAFVGFKRDGDRFELRAIDPAKLVALLRAEPGVIKHRLIDRNAAGGPQDPPTVVFLAETGELQRFFRDRLADDAMFATEAVTYVRAAKP